MTDTTTHTMDTPQNPNRLSDHDKRTLKFIGGAALALLVSMGGMTAAFEFFEPATADGVVKLNGESSTAVQTGEPAPVAPQAEAAVTGNS